MNKELTIEEIATTIELARSLTRRQKDELLDRLEKEISSNNGEITLSVELIEDLTRALDQEINYIKHEAIPEEETLFEESAQDYAVEINHARPEFVELIEEYERETAFLMEQNKKDYIVLDKALDELLQEHKNKSEEAEIASIKQKLAFKPSNK